MRFEQTITLEITNWPRFARTTTFAFDARLFPDERSLRGYAQQRFGNGTLHSAGEGRWVYRRRVPGPGWLWGLLARILNKSYA